MAFINHVKSQLNAWNRTIFLSPQSAIGSAISNRLLDSRCWVRFNFGRKLSIRPLQPSLTKPFRNLPRIRRVALLCGAENSFSWYMFVWSAGLVVVNLNRVGTQHRRCSHLGNITDLQTNQLLWLVLITSFVATTSRGVTELLLKFAVFCETNYSLMP